MGSDAISQLVDELNMILWVWGLFYVNFWRSSSSNLISLVWVVKLFGSFTWLAQWDFVYRVLEVLDIEGEVGLVGEAGEISSNAGFNF